MPRTEVRSVAGLALTAFALLRAATIAVLYGRVRAEFALNAIPSAALALVALQRLRRNPWKLALSSIGIRVDPGALPKPMELVPPTGCAPTSFHSSPCQNVAVTLRSPASS